jgi:hypothetical protein
MKRQISAAKLIFLRQAVHQVCANDIFGGFW